MEKKVVELFAGVGGFRVGLEKLHSGWKTVWFSQWEPEKKNQWAHDCYEEHFGKCADLDGNTDRTGQDISAMPKDRIPDHALLVGGFPCLAGDTLILSDRGLVPIAEITPGDMVMSHDGALHMVTDVFNQGEKYVYHILGYGFDGLKATGNHRFFIRRKEVKYLHRGVVKRFLPPEWISVEEMKSMPSGTVYFGNRINEDDVVPEWNGIDVYTNKYNKKRVCNLDMQDETLWYLAGRYIGDGWLRRQYKSGSNRAPYSGIVICCGKHKAEDFEKKITGRFTYVKTEERTVYKYIFSGVELAAFISQFGTGASEKCLPYFVHRLPVSLLKKFLDGYMDSDGCIVNNRIQFTTVSRKLAYDIASVMEKMYRRPCQIYKTHVKEKKVIKGRVVNQRDSYLVRCVLENERYSAFYEDGYIWYPIRKIIPSGKAQVFDIEVEGTHSFMANRAVCHNCQSYSVANSLSSATGIEGKKGVLWWQIRDTIIAKKPAFCLLENVDRLLKSPAKQRGRDFGIILACFRQLGYSVEWRIVNAAQYGSVQRRRRTFLFAYRNDTEYGKKMKTVSVEDILKTDGLMAKAFPVVSAGEAAMTVLPEDLVEVSDTFAFAFEKAGYMTGGKVWTADVTVKEEAPVLLGDILESGVDEKYYIKEEDIPKWQYLKGAKRINRTAKNGHEYVYSEGPVAFPDPPDRPGRTMLTGESTLNRSTHVVADPATGRLRTLTPVEAERMQGFDDNWTNTGMPERMRYFCMGNALVTDMITRMGKVLDDIVRDEP